MRQHQRKGSLIIPHTCILLIVSSLLLPGSKTLLLVNIYLLRTQQPRRKMHVRQRSDDLMEYLEMQLGSIESEYMEVRLTYSHSAFPHSDHGDHDSGIASVETRLETTLTASIKRHNPSSPWSPPPAPIPNYIFDIVGSYWGKSAVDGLLQKNLAFQITPRKAATLACRAPPVDCVVESRSVHSLKSSTPSIPSRRSSLRQASLERSLDPARKIWAEMRRASSSSKSYQKQSPSVCGERAGPLSSCLGVSSSPGRGEVNKRRQTLRETALRNQRSIGADTLRSLVPTMAESSIDEKHVHKRRIEKENKAIGTKTRKDSGRWPWASWW